MVEVNAGGQGCCVDQDLRRDINHELRPLTTILYDRVKVKRSAFVSLFYMHSRTPNKSSGINKHCCKSLLEPHETVEASVPCTCVGPHEPLAVQIGVDGFPRRNSLEGNHLCWWNQFHFVRMGLKPGEKILRKWARRHRRWGFINWSDRHIQQTMQRFARYCQLERHKEIRNTWGRKSCVTIGLGDMQLPARQIPNNQIDPHWLLVLLWVMIVRLFLVVFRVPVMTVWSNLLKFWRWRSPLTKVKPKCSVTTTCEAARPIRKLLRSVSCHPTLAAKWRDCHRQPSKNQQILPNTHTFLDSTPSPTT